MADAAASTIQDTNSSRAEPAKAVPLSSRRLDVNHCQSTTARGGGMDGPNGIAISTLLMPNTQAAASGSRICRCRSGATPTNQALSGL